MSFTKTSKVYRYITFGLFTVGLVMPALFLAYLGTLFLVHEAQTQKKQNEDRYSQLVDLAENKISEVIGHLSQVTKNAVPPTVIRDSSIPVLTSVLYNTKRLDDAMVHALFVVDEHEELLVPPPVKDITVTPDIQKMNWGVYTSEIESLEKKEFVEKDILAALKGYQQLEARIHEERLHAMLLKSIAGCYRKMNNISSAEKTYKELIRRHDPVIDPVGYPMGILGWQLLIQTYQMRHDNERVLSTAFDLYESLLWHHWSIGPTTSEKLKTSLALEIENSLKEIPGNSEYGARWFQLRELEKNLSRWEKSTLHFYEADWPGIVTRLRKKGWQDKDGCFQLVPRQLSHSVIVVTIPLVDQKSGIRKRRLVAVISDNSLLDQMNGALNDLAKLNRVSIQLGSEKGLSATLVSIQRNVQSIDPPLTVTLTELPNEQNRKMNERRLWIFGGMIVLSVLILICGVILIFRVTRQESEIADLKADFVANVSHELRTPLTAISYISDCLNQDRFKNPADIKDFHVMLAEETERLKLLVEDVLDFSKILNGKKTYRQASVEFNDLVKDAVSQFSLKAQIRGFLVKVTYSTELLNVYVERKATIQAILNLLDNAMKYSGDSSQINVEVFSDAGLAKVAIHDFGVGIAPSDHQKIFEKFYRVEKSSTRASEGGVGLGLAMVKHIVENQNGTIRLNSDLGEGSTFFLSFPLIKMKGNRP